MTRYLDDFTEGEVIKGPGFTLSEGQILDFALTYDPQPFHIDNQAAAEGPYGGLIASGFQTLALCFRMIVQSGVFQTVSMGGPGIDELRFLAPVRPGDTITPSATILSVTPSRSKPDRGVLKIQFRGYNQHGDEVISFIVIMMGRRH
ncbi:MaoC family dehydratase [Oceanospirillum sediminis]|uniref:MaoC family dehydratase n=1 Tax=Oceanospirillum sediminis TaxID=2760088 RepID=A0A839IWK2_9GAMM|nr:MaoC family dehydratase [Oceanospirillum sediminis]MBB1489004.1 MaoC family dehydratase [Oceanospirillum sediminis]